MKGQSKGVRSMSGLEKDQAPVARQPSTGGAGLKGKRASVLASFRGGRGAASPVDAGPQSPGVDATQSQKLLSGGPGLRPRPGEIADVRQGALGSPAIGVRVAPGNSARQQESSRLELGPRPQSPMREPAAPSMLATTHNSTLAPRAAMSPLRSPLGEGSPQFAPRPLSPRPGAVSMDSALQGPGTPLQPGGRTLSLRGNLSPGPKTGPQKMGFGKRSPGANAETFSAMSTVSALSVSEDASSQPRRIGRFQRGGPQTVPGQRNFNPITGSPRIEQSPQRDNSSLMSPRSWAGETGPRSTGWDGATAKQYKSARAPRSADGEDEAERRQRGDLTWSKNGGHFSRVHTNFDKGVRRMNPFCAVDELHGSACMINPKTKKEAAEEEGGVKARSENIVEIHKRANSGQEVKLAMVGCTALFGSDDGELNRDTCPADFSTPAGAASRDCSNNGLPTCWRPPPQTFTGDDEAGASGPSQACLKTVQQKQNSSQVKAATDWEKPHDQALEEEIMEHYCKYYYGRPMKLNRMNSEPPRPRERKQKFQFRQLNCDWSKDESSGAVVPCLSTDTIRKSESHNWGEPQHKAEGEFSLGPSAYTKALGLQAAQSELRGEYFDKKHGEMERSMSVPSMRPGSSGSPRRRNPLLGEGQDAEEAAKRASGRLNTSRSERLPLTSPSSGYIDVPAGMSSLNLDSSAAVSSNTVNTDRTQTGGARGRPEQHGETPVMTSILKNSVAKDMGRFREYRETYDRPFVELCSAFNQIRYSQVKDANRIRAEVDPHSSRHVAALMCHDPRPCGRDAEVSMKSTSKEPTFGTPVPDRSSRARSPGARSPGRYAASSQSSQGVGDALKWVC